MPYPSGPHWGKLKNDALYRKKAIKRLASDDQEEERLLSAMKCYRKQAFKAHGRNAIAEIIKATVSLQASDRRSKELPKTIVEALMGERAEEWVPSIHKEWQGLIDQGVFSHDYSKKDLEKMGITGKREFETTHE